jgi:hypothetical protein
MAGIMELAAGRPCRNPPFHSFHKEKRKKQRKEKGYYYVLLPLGKVP